MVIFGQKLRVGQRHAVCGVGTVVRSVHTQVFAKHSTGVTMVLLLQLYLSPTVREGSLRNT